MSNRNIRVLQIRVNSQLQKQSEKSSKNSFLPAINNQNYLQNHYGGQNCINYYQSAQNKRNNFAFTSKNYENNENLQPEGRIKVHGDMKKMTQPFVGINRSLIKTTASRKIDEIEDKQGKSSQTNGVNIQTTRAKSIDISTFPSCLKNQHPTHQIIKIEKPNKKSSRLLFRDRTNSCKVATRRGLFPFSERHRQPFRVGEYFEQNFQKLSTIAGQSDHGSSKFISLDSFPELTA